VADSVQPRVADSVHPGQSLRESLVFKSLYKHRSYSLFLGGKVG
jgi:hypothetical protein